MMLAAAITVVALLEQIERASHAEPPVFQVETLLMTAERLPVEKYGSERREFLVAARRVSAAVRDEASRAVFQIGAARLMAMQDKEEAAQWCREMTGEAAVRCWGPVDALEGARALQALEKRDELQAAARDAVAAGDEKAAEAVLGKWQKQAKPLVEQKKKEKPKPVGRAVKERMDRIDEDDTTDVERSRLLREVMDLSETIEDVSERLVHEGVIAAWFAEHREEATAALAAAKLHRTFADVCQCEDGQCDSIAGRAECSENIDYFVEYLAERKVDPAALRIRHPSLAARALLQQLKEAVQ